MLAQRMNISNSYMKDGTNACHSGNILYKDTIKRNNYGSNQNFSKNNRKSSSSTNSDKRLPENNVIVISGKRNTSDGAKEINISNICSYFVGLASTDKQKRDDSYSWLMVNKRPIRSYLIEQTNKIRDEIKNTKDKSKRQPLLKFRKIIQLNSTSLTMIDNENISIRDHPGPPHWEILMHEAFKLKILDYSAFDGTEQHGDKYDMKTDYGKASLLFRIAVFSLPIKNPCAEITLSYGDFWKFLGWLDSYSDDVIYLFGIDRVYYDNLENMNRKLLTLVNYIFDICCECPCYINEQENTFTKGSSEKWSNYQ